MRTECLLPALSLFCGVSPAHEHRCLAVKNTDISTPISDIIAIAEKGFLIPGTVDTREHCLAYGSDSERIMDSRSALHFFISL